MSDHWCSLISDGTRINQLAIPGTHDAAAWTHYSGAPGLKGTWAQRKSITEQLDLGVRVLDLRIGWTMGWGWYIGMYHGPIYLSLTLQEVLDDINNWLASHAREFVIVVFQQQGKTSKADLSANVRTMVNATFGNRWFRFIPNRQQWPTVGELRGKALVMGRLKADVVGFCNVRDWLTVGDNSDGTLINAGTSLRLFLQDRYKKVSGQGGFVSFDDDNKKKFAKVKAAAQTTVELPPHRLLRINHMSYSNLRYQPWELGQGVNTLLRASTIKIKGVLMIDDADQPTVDHILAHNELYWSQSQPTRMTPSFRPGRGWEI